MNTRHNILDLVDRINTELAQSYDLAATAGRLVVANTEVTVDPEAAGWEAHAFTASYDKAGQELAA
jgi:hypothetical protein